MGRKENIIKRIYEINRNKENGYFLQSTYRIHKTAGIGGQQ